MKLIHDCQEWLDFLWNVSVLVLLFFYNKRSLCGIIFYFRKASRWPFYNHQSEHAELSLHGADCCKRARVFRGHQALYP